MKQGSNSRRAKSGKSCQHGAPTAAETSVGALQFNSVLGLMTLVLMVAEKPSLALVAIYSIH